MTAGWAGWGNDDGGLDRKSEKPFVGNCDGWGLGALVVAVKLDIVEVEVLGMPLDGCFR